MPEMKQPDKMGSYSAEDVVFLLRDISTIHLEIANEQRERLIQSGTHYSEMLPVEYLPSEAYMKLFYLTLDDYAQRIALAVGLVAQQIVERRGLDNLVLVSLARAGTPIGILIKRYIKMHYNVSVPHYTMSILRGRGIDDYAIRYIYSQHPLAQIQFIDGWTGKGAITRELQQACESYNEQNNEQLDATLAVLADPGHCAAIYGTRADFLIPSACLNSTVSGLVSRTVWNAQFMDVNDFHGAKFYKELQHADVSNLYIDRISAYFLQVEKDVEQQLRARIPSTITWKGLESVIAIQQHYGITNSNFVKPGVGETTRVLLRRVPWKILINPTYVHELAHILLLAKEKNVEIEEYPQMSYACCGLIKEV
ncbi:cysteine protease StiP family protein [Lysinibacillus sp. JNUCC-52]|uniref:cysteine protease StiP family protein n=1 Tax=Lysinibacillus sp. JNUCC-52 TaxID=2792480 RepID=UPI0019362910|nr:cysteine protease StiP family protein [Lysinibacillus sp. JNUCC-52]